MVSVRNTELWLAVQFTALVTRWQHHAAAVGVFLVWGELMLMVGRLPTFGTRLTQSLQLHTRARNEGLSRFHNHGEGPY